ncbi:hypothetical protein B0T17DRAFT_616058 [Bombardia bombarda]|uniref:Uncharacterized protein n=1 Tax=Bombardia bombarda TaxID=252184 RepID=A0AA40CAL9_9PEZI|nr:hypothetical protein B0T17DRAFT_616058 [Bombardia bombarda]
MGSTDIPPDHCPWWLVPLHTAVLGFGVLLWDAAYILMTRRALATKSYGMPLMSLAMNVSCDTVYAFYVCEALLETVGYSIWLYLNAGLVYTTVRFGSEDWKTTSPWVGRNIGWLLALMTAIGCVGHYAFAAWWLAEPGRGGSGNKEGKWWYGQDGLDTSEMGFWSSGVCQIALSAGSVAMLLVRGHSGGTSYAIWFCRAVGTLSGLVLCNVLMWWYCPEAHGFIFNPFAVFLWGAAVVCDIVYPFLLWQVRRTEIILPDGRLMSGSTQKDTLEFLEFLNGQKKNL